MKCEFSRSYPGEDAASPAKDRTKEAAASDMSELNLKYPEWPDERLARLGPEAVEQDGGRLP